MNSFYGFGKLSGFGICKFETTHILTTSEFYNVLITVKDFSVLITTVKRVNFL